MNFSNLIDVTMDSNHILHVVFREYPQPSPSGGGIYIPVDKLALFAPYIALASTILVATVILALSISVAIIKHRKKQ